MKVFFFMNYIEIFLLLMKIVLCEFQPNSGFVTLVPYALYIGMYKTGEISGEGIGNHGQRWRHRRRSTQKKHQQNRLQQ